ncbi:uncharacterized protein LOC117057639 [Lacerta agilis]|uniref:uncharacterized protein LOC117057639 n=1 Tax=Lacerta agilis TaxID=80427 RepID=UPI001419B995|nr:uncharacterized protein LOC117057639 [Lacerta agilis]
MNIIPLLGAVLANSRNSAIHLLPFLIMSYSATGNSTSPLIVLDQYEGSGIRLVCKSENVRSPELLQLSWMDGKGQELSATPTTLGKSSIENSVLLEWGSGSAVSCRITNKSSNTPIGSTSLVIADIFFPSTSLCMVGFFVIAVLIINVIIVTYLKLNHDRWKIAFSGNHCITLWNDLWDCVNRGNKGLSKVCWVGQSEAIQVLTMLRFLPGLKVYALFVIRFEVIL